MTKAKGGLLLAAPAMVLAGLIGLPGAAYAQADGGLPTIESHTAGFERLDGFLPLYWDDDAGTLWLEVEQLGVEVLYVNALAAGVGSNDIGLDRGQLGGSRIVRFERVGRKVLMVQPNYRYRATTSIPAERRAVEDAFATSVLFGFTAAARTDDRFLVEATPFLLRDVHGVAARLPGAYRLDGRRSAVYLPRTKAFPANTEMEAILTFARERRGDGPGFGRGSVEAVAPSAEAVTVRQRQSFIALPDDGYTPRPYDPRAGYGAVSYDDYAARLGEPLTRRYLRRHRLEKRDPGAEVSEPVEPIVYYLDRGTPEPVRSALLDGARWWNQAFEAAGYRDAFRVELMPEGADALDVRYNVIQWVHRSTRGWSYGSSVTDPRTGEIIKGHVTLGSLRVRQDYLIAEGLLSPYLDGDEEPAELAELALARIRQLSAHEVGHTLGLGHNYYASRRGRISVMDYPQPGDRQRAALAALLRTLEPAELTLPESVLQRIPPRPPGHGLHRELFPRRTGPVFDALTPAVVAADLTVSQILTPSRAARLVEQALLDGTLPDLGEVIGTLIDAVFDAAAGTTYEFAVRRAVQRVVVERLMGLADRAPMAEVRAHAWSALEAVVGRARLEPRAEALYGRFLAGDIERFLARPGRAVPAPVVPAPVAPPGSPIGDPPFNWLGSHPELCAWERQPGF